MKEYLKYYIFQQLQRMQKPMDKSKFWGKLIHMLHIKFEMQKNFWNITINIYTNMIRFTCHAFFDEKANIYPNIMFHKNGIK
jgi:hypothetical protein